MSIPTKHAFQWTPFVTIMALFFCRDHTNFVNCVRFSLDGNKFITVSSDKKGLVYDAKTAEKIGELSSEDGHKGSIYVVSWSPASKQVSLVFDI